MFLNQKKILKNQKQILIPNKTDLTKLVDFY